MHIEVNGKTFACELAQNATAAAFENLLPMELGMSELNGNEKYHYLMGPLPARASRVGKIEKGDIMLFEDSCVVVFYKSFSTPYSYTRIGRITNPDGLEKALGRGSSTVKFAK